MARSLLLSLFFLLLSAAHDVTGEHGHVDLAEELSSQGNTVYNHSDIEDQHGFMNNVTDWEIFPHPGLESQFFNSSRRSLGSFQDRAKYSLLGGTYSTNEAKVYLDTGNRVKSSLVGGSCSTSEKRTLLQ